MIVVNHKRISLAEGNIFSPSVIYFLRGDVKYLLNNFSFPNPVFILSWSRKEVNCPNWSSCSYCGLYPV